MRSTTLGLAATSLLALAACGSKGSDGAGTEMSDAGRVETIASTLQACSYDGRPMKAQPAALNGAAPGDCATAVKRVMEHTGLPSNFTVVSGPVDNAAAVILLDNARIPRRVIAFNPQFMRLAAEKVGGDPWGPVSILAHEIAHHLSGHTIIPGGSRPEIELEADKFSGFVLQKMGAPLADATKMILTVGSDHASATHPAKQQRADVIRQGWMESCRQAGGKGCDAGTAAPVRPAAQPAPQPLPSAAPQPSVTPPPAGGVPAMTPASLPQPGSVPFKYGRFVADETGKLDAARLRTIDAKLYALARDSGVEFTVLVVNDLRGLSADDFAWAMMRQLRVGKLDVGNGAVVVVAPRQRQAAVAFGPGLAKEAEFSKPVPQLLSWIDNGWRYCDDADGCGVWTDSLLGPFNFTLFNAERAKWTIQFQTLGQLLSHYEAVEAERMRSKRPFDAKLDQPLGNLLRVSGKITSLSAPTGTNGANERILGGPLGYTAVSMTTDDGLPLSLYVSPRTIGLQPGGKLQAGQRYTVVGRLQKRGDRKQQASGMWLFSYDPLTTA